MIGWIAMLTIFVLALIAKVFGIWVLIGTLIALAFGALMFAIILGDVQ